jgi:hypothetical protein
MALFFLSHMIWGVSKYQDMGNKKNEKLLELLLLVKTVFLSQQINKQYYLSVVFFSHRQQDLLRKKILLTDTNLL